MKKQFAKLLVLSIVPIVAITFGCKKDQIVQNKFTYDLKDYPIKTGNQTLYVPSGHSPKETYNFDLVLASSGITFDNTANDFKGKGDFVALTMFSLDPETIAPGLYTFDIFASKDSLTFDEGVVGTDYDIVVDTASTIYDIKNGVMNVEKNGNIYTLDFDLYTKENKQVKGYYKGLLDLHTPPLVAKKKMYHR